MSDRLQDYFYEYPDDLVALYPCARRDESRLMVVHPSSQTLEHRQFADIVDYFKSGDVLVLNNSKVFPCRLITQRSSGGRQEILLLHQSDFASHSQKKSIVWKALINAAHKVKSGDVFTFAGLEIEILDDAGNERFVELRYEGELTPILSRLADMPLPPYIHRKNESLDRERYQTVFARKSGSVAAPTAGLHFTVPILEKLKLKGVQIAEVTLHVGPGTFLPVRSDDLASHKMHEEFFSIDENSCAILNNAKQQNRRITAVGTTTTRVLETLAQKKTNFAAQSGTTNIFIRPPFTFKTIDRLITNFHQPESTLIMLVSALAGREFILNAYREALKKKYRLFSYGDAMLIES